MAKIKLIKLLRVYATFSVAFLLAYVISGFASPVSNSSAVTCKNGMVSGTDDICGTDNTDVNVSIEGSWTVSISSAGTLGVNITPQGSGVTSTVTDNVNIYTNTPNGYQLYLSSTSGITDIYNNSDTQQERNHFIATTGTKASPVSLTSNSWGYSLASSPTTFSKVETSSSASDSLISSGSKTSGTGDNLGVTYGFKADTKLTPGTYTTSVTYTAVAEVPSYTLSSITPNELHINDQTAKQITIMTTTPVTELSLGDITARITDTTNTVNLTNCNEIASNGYRGATCTYTGNLPVDTYNVQLTSSWHSATYTLVDGFQIYKTVQDITTMQEMTTDICSRLPESTAAVDNRVTLKDSRDQKQYKISKLADGNCWMVQNLALDGGRTLYSSDSNVVSDIALPPNIADGASWSDTNIQIINNLAGYDGNLYNWCAAVVTSNCTSITAGNATTSICPKQWRLPNKDGSPSYYGLFSAGGITILPTIEQRVAAIMSSPYYLALSGHHSGSYGSQGRYGNYWTNAAYSALGADHLRFYHFDQGNGIDYNVDDTKRYELSVRCVFGE